MRYRLAAAAAATTLAAVAIPGTAHAVGQDGVIETNEFVFYYSANFTGSYDDFSAGKSDLAGYTFIKSGLSGYGTPVKNNSASVRNKKNQAARVYSAVAYTGVSDYIDPLESTNLSLTSNTNESFKWI